MRLLRPVLVVVTSLSGARRSAAPVPGASPVDTAAVSTDPTGAHVELRHGDTWVERPHEGGGAAADHRVPAPLGALAGRVRAADHAGGRLPPGPDGAGARSRVPHVPRVVRRPVRGERVAAPAAVRRRPARRSPSSSSATSRTRRDGPREPRRARPHRARVVVLGRRATRGPSTTRSTSSGMTVTSRRRRPRPLGLRRRHDRQRRSGSAAPPPRPVDRRPTSTSGAPRPTLPRPGAGPPRRAVPGRRGPVAGARSGVPDRGARLPGRRVARRARPRPLSRRTGRTGRPG